MNEHNKTRMLSLLGYGAFGMVLIFLDRLSKYCVLQYVVDQRVINPCMALYPLFNRGISWGMLHSPSALQFIMVSVGIGIITILLIIYTALQYSNNNVIYPEIMVIAGSLSNMIDRVWYGGVLDFILLSYGEWHFAVFNVADIFIVTGVGLMMYKCYKSI